MKKKLLFIHVAKTGGSSIRQMLNTTSPRIEYDCIHNGKLISFLNNKIIRKAINDKVLMSDYEKTAYFVRNPYDRLLSCYKYFRSGGLNRKNNELHQGDKERQALILKQFPEFKDCCHNLNEFSALVPHAKPMSESIFSHCDLMIDAGNIVVGRFEAFNEGVVNLFDQLGVAVKPNEIMKTNRSPKTEYLRFDESMKNVVYQFYKKDFELFNYQLPQGRSTII